MIEKEKQILQNKDKNTQYINKTRNINLIFESLYFCRCLTVAKFFLVKELKILICEKGFDILLGRTRGIRDKIVAFPQTYISYESPCTRRERSFNVDK